MVGATAAVVVPGLMRLNLSGIFLGTGRMLAYNLSLAGLVVSRGWSAPSSCWFPFMRDVQQAVLLWSGIQILGSTRGIAAVYAEAPPARRRSARACGRRSGSASRPMPPT